MLITKKMLIVLTLVGALVGAGIGALVTRSAQSSTAANTGYDTNQPNNSTVRSPEQIAAEDSSQYTTAAEQKAFRQGFDEGYSSCNSAAVNTGSRAVAYPAAYRTSTSRRYYNGRRAYYDYGSARHGRTFWQKHRDKLTLAIGTGTGAAIGGLVGGKRGAGIGSLVGLGSSALYTYKLRHRSRRY